MRKMLIVFVLVFLVLISLGFASGQTTPQSPTVCCEKTLLSGLPCQDVPKEQCNLSARYVSTSCSATTYCRPGTCFDSGQGTCLDNTPQLNCGPGGIWKTNPGPECALGCCILGDQAAFVTLTRCKKLSADLGLETNYKTDVRSEATCIASVLGQEKGACVFESDFQNTCRITTRAACAGGISENLTKGTFFTGKLCTATAAFNALNISVNCGRQNKKVCVTGKEEVYFVDTCGNIANIYDAAKVNDQVGYWEDILDKGESCNPNSANANSASCGNCNYLEGSICRTDSKGTAKCTDLNCYDTSNGNDYKHGESWCVYNDAGLSNTNNAVGSRFYKHICINGEEVLEQCDDFRQQVCIGDSINYLNVTFSQAACRANRWQDCKSQGSQSTCENSDARDCTWLPEITAKTGSEPKTLTSKGSEAKLKTVSPGVCVPTVSPGLRFWEGSEAGSVCGQGSITFQSKYEKSLSGDKTWTDIRVDKNGNPSAVWLGRVSTECHSLGDCVGSLTPSGIGSVSGSKINWLGTGSRSGA